MNPTGRVLFFWSGYSAMNGLFLGLFLWSVLPFGGQTLPHILEQSWDITFRHSALAVSLACGLLAVGAISLTLLSPAVLDREHEETCRNEI